MKQEGVAIPLVSEFSGFTLIEMLVVTVIIAALTALLLAAGPQISRNFERVQCMSNLQRISIMMQQYAADNAGLFPAPKANGDSWWAALGKMQNPNYTVTVQSDNKVFVCPSAKRTYPGGQVRRTYAINAEPGTMATSVRVSSNTQPSRSLFVIDMKSNPAEPVDAQFLFRATKDPLFSAYVDARHDGKFGGLFADGHVEMLLPTDPDIPEMIKNFGK